MLYVVGFFFPWTNQATDRKASEMVYKAGPTTLLIPVSSFGKAILRACFPVRMDSLQDRN